jgi:hypothetical protein
LMVSNVRAMTERASECDSVPLTSTDDH